MKLYRTRIVLFRSIFWFWSIFFGCFYCKGFSFQLLFYVVIIFFLCLILLLTSLTRRIWCCYLMFSSFIFPIQCYFMLLCNFILLLLLCSLFQFYVFIQNDMFSNGLFCFNFMLLFDILHFLWPFYVFWSLFYVVLCYVAHFMLFCYSFTITLLHCLMVGIAGEKRVR